MKLAKFNVCLDPSNQKYSHVKKEQKLAYYIKSENLYCFKNINFVSFYQLKHY